MQDQATHTQKPRTIPVLGFAIEHRYALTLAAAMLLFAWLGITRYLGAGRDDAFITLWAGEQLAAGHGLVNHNFQPLEISSSLLHVLIVAVLAFIAPENTFVANKLAGLAAGLAVLVVIHRHRDILIPWPRLRYLTFLFILAAVATNPTFLYWTLGGLETPFVALLLLLCAVYFLRYWTTPTPPNELKLIAAQIALLTARPEAFYILAFNLVYAALFIHAQKGRAALLRITLIPAGFFLSLGLFRIWAFGTFFPNTVYAKTGPLSAKVTQGSHYVQQFFLSGYFQQFLAVALLLIVIYYATLLTRSLWRRDLLKERPDGANIFVLGLVITATLVVVCSGGDWMERFRFTAPLLPLLAILATGFLFRLVGACLDRMQTSGFSPFTARLFGALIAVLLIPLWISNLYQNGAVTTGKAPFLLTVQDCAIPCPLPELIRPEGGLDQYVKTHNKTYERDAAILLPFLDSEFATVYEQTGPLVIATPQMGLFPYYLRKKYPDFDLRFIDTWGLCDQNIALLDLPGGHFGKGIGGAPVKVLAGEAGPLSDYVIAQNPNMIYGVDGSELTIARYQAMGYEPVLKRLSALIVVKQTHTK